MAGNGRRFADTIICTQELCILYILAYY